MAKVSAAQYEAFRAQMKSKLGVKIEASKAGAKGSADYLGGFNRIKEEEKQEIAKTFDSKLDLQLQADLAAVMKKHGARRYIDLICKEGAAADLKKLGIVVQSLDKSGNPKKPKNGDRNWLISRVDSNGNLIKDEKGALAQFKMKDFNSDSYIQNCELYVNDLLKIAGYDCVSSLDLSPEELAQIASLQGDTSDIGLEGTELNAFMQDYMKQMGLSKYEAVTLQQMYEKLGVKMELEPGKFSEDKYQFTKEEEDSREKVTQREFEKLVEELIDESKDENGEPSLTVSNAEDILLRDYTIKK